MQGSSLSDEAVIQTLNSQFIPLYADVDVYGFPEGIPGIKKYRSMWQFMEKHKWGIATSAVVDSTGSKMLGESGSGFFFEWKTSTNYYPDKFLAYLQKSLDSAGINQRLSKMAPVSRDDSPSHVSKHSAQ